MRFKNNTKNLNTEALKDRTSTTIHNDPPLNLLRNDTGNEQHGASTTGRDRGEKEQDAKGRSGHDKDKLNTSRADC